MPIIELFLGAFLQALLNKLASRELLNFTRHGGIDTRLKNWEKMLMTINQVLDDAEDRLLTGDLGVKLWLGDLRNLAYDIEDLLDEFVTECAKSKSKAETGTSKAPSLLPSCCFKLSVRELILDHRMTSKIEEINNRLSDIIIRIDILRLRENSGKQSTHSQRIKPILTTHLPEPFVVSREVEKMEILRLLTEDEDDGTCVNLKVIPIIGMGGIGKTALAQQVYNDAIVTSYFDVKAWVCVSDVFDLCAITKSILEMINGNLACEGRSLDWLQHKLHENLSRRKFLVILDDVWTKNNEDWIMLMKLFRSGVKGSKIVITTRNRTIALLVGGQPYILRELPRDACMTLFAFHVFGVGNFDRHPHLEELGKKIVDRCEGLPLAVKTLAGLLRTKRNPHEWEAISNNRIWEIPEERNDILPALKLSYLNLPSQLKRCFAYCAIFPQDYEIERDELIHWWIAEGLLSGQEGKNRWNIGLQYFNELVSRSIFQKSSSKGLRFLMHDLVNDLAKAAAGATYFSSGEFEFENDPNSASLARHASFISDRHITRERFMIYHGMKGLRSFISLGKQPRHYNRSFVSQKVLCDLLLRLKYLRVLSLNHYCIREVPDCIGELRLLRYLNLSYTDIETLPESIVELYNLEALMLQGCQDLIELPKDMWKLVNLRFLDIMDTLSLREMPLYIGNLVGLEMLSKFVVGIENESRLRELKNLKNLQMELCIFDLHMVREASDAENASLCTKKGISRLTMQWSEDFETFQDEELEAEVLHFLCPHQYLEALTLSYYGGLKFPSWLGSPSHVTIVRLQGCHRVKALPSLGKLPSLKELFIEGLNAISKVGPEFYGTKSHFPSLITLEFRDMPQWEDWSHGFGIEVGVLFPHLERLVIRNCRMLIGRLPSQLSSLKQLIIKSCPRMDNSPFIISLPSLNELYFGGCNERVLKSLVKLTSLTALVIVDVAELTCLNDGITSSLTKLEKLEIKSCENLIYLWQEREVIRNLTHLKSLLIKSCPKFISFMVGERDIELPGNLETIHLEDCSNLEKLPGKIHMLSSLRHLTIRNCPKLMSFPETGIPASVLSLKIIRCEILQSLPRGLSIHLDEPSSSSTNLGDMMSCLKELTISECNSLPASPISKGRFLYSDLKTLQMQNCRGVKSLADLDRLQSLQVINIWCCEDVRSLPECLHTLSHLTSLTLGNCPALELECFPPLPPGILDFCLYGCPKIKSLPNQLHQLVCLRDVAIQDCQSITHFPEGGLPPQLKGLMVMQCRNMKQPVREWLTYLTSLQYLSIDGSVGGVGEEEDLLLCFPSSLLQLGLHDMRNLKRLSNSLPSSLQRLWIIQCPKLRYLPQDGLPPSLQQLWIKGCGILRERCSKLSGSYWNLIHEIPEVVFYES